MSQADQKFEQRVKTALESGMSALDTDTRRKLAAGRTRALTQTSFFRRWLPAGSWIPATALASCTMLVITLFVVSHQPDVPIQVAQSDTEFALELLLSEDTEIEPDFYIVMDAMMSEEEEQHAS